MIVPGGSIVLSEAMLEEAGWVMFCEAVSDSGLSEVVGCEVMLSEVVSDSVLSEAMLREAMLREAGWAASYWTSLSEAVLSWA